MSSSTTSLRIMVSGLKPTHTPEMADPNYKRWITSFIERTTMKPSPASPLMSCSRGKITASVTNNATIRTPCQYALIAKSAALHIPVIFFDDPDKAPVSLIRQLTATLRYPRHLAPFKLRASQFRIVASRKQLTIALESFTVIYTLAVASATLAPYTLALT